MAKEFNAYLAALNAGEINAATFAELTMNLSKENK